MNGPRRRGLLGGVAALASAAVAPGSTVNKGADAAAAPAEATARRADPDAVILALCQRFHALNHEAHTLPDEGEAARTYDHALAERWVVSDELQDMRPSTRAGQVAKAGVALALMEENTFGGAIDSADEFAMATLRQIAGRAPVRLVGEAAAPVHPDAELIATCGRFIESSRAYGTVCSAEPNDGDPGKPGWAAQEAAASDACNALADEVLELPCKTLAGALALADAVVAYSPEVLQPSGYTDEALMRRLVAVVLPLRGAA